MQLSSASSDRGTFTFSSRIERDTTSTTSRLLAPYSRIDRDGSIWSACRPYTDASRCFFTTAAICSRLTLPPSRSGLLPQQPVHERLPAVHHDELSAHPVHQAAAQRHHHVAHLLGLQVAALPLQAAVDSLEVLPHRQPERLGADEVRPHQVDPHVLAGQPH